MEPVFKTIVDDEFEDLARWIDRRSQKAHRSSDVQLKIFVRGACSPDHARRARKHGDPVLLVADGDELSLVTREVKLYNKASIETRVQKIRNRRKQRQDIQIRNARDAKVSQQMNVGPVDTGLSRAFSPETVAVQDTCTFDEDCDCPGCAVELNYTDFYDIDYYSADLDNEIEEIVHKFFGHLPCGPMNDITEYVIGSWMDVHLPGWRVAQKLKPFCVPIHVSRATGGALPFRQFEPGDLNEQPGRKDWYTQACRIMKFYGIDWCNHHIPQEGNCRVCDNATRVFVGKGDCPHHQYDGECYMCNCDLCRIVGCVNCPYSVFKGDIQEYTNWLAPFWLVTVIRCFEAVTKNMEDYHCYNDGECCPIEDIPKFIAEFKKYRSNHRHTNLLLPQPYNIHGVDENLNIKFQKVDPMRDKSDFKPMSASEYTSMMLKAKDDNVGKVTQQMMGFFSSVKKAAHEVGEGVPKVVQSVTDTMKNFNDTLGKAVSGFPSAVMDYAINTICTSVIVYACGRMLWSGICKEYMLLAGAASSILCLRSTTLRSYVDSLMQLVVTRKVMQQMNSSELSVFTKAAAAIVAVVTVGKSNKKLETVISTVSHFPQFSEGMADFGMMVMGWIEKVVNAIRCDFLGEKEHTRLVTSGFEQLDSWVEECEELCAEMDEKGSLPNNNDVRMQLIRLQNIGREFLAASNKGSIMAGFRDRIHFYLRKLDEFFSPYRALGQDMVNNRPEPFAVRLSGGTAVGKSTVTTIFRDALIVSMLPASELDTFVKTPAAICYYWGPEQKYLEGYNGHRFFCVDDAWQLSETAGQLDALSGFLIGALNAAPKPLHMASLENKGKVFFTSEIVFVTTNYQTAGAVAQSINHKDALDRRFNLNMRVVANPGFVKRIGQDDSCDWEKINARHQAGDCGCPHPRPFGSFCEDANRFIAYQVVKEGVTNDLTHPMTFKEAVQYAVRMLHLHRNRTSTMVESIEARRQALIDERRRFLGVNDMVMQQMNPEKSPPDLLTMNATTIETYNVAPAEETEPVSPIYEFMDMSTVGKYVVPVHFKMLSVEKKFSIVEKMKERGVDYPLEFIEYWNVALSRKPSAWWDSPEGMDSFILANGRSFPNWRARCSLGYRKFKIWLDEARASISSFWTKWKGVFATIGGLLAVGGIVIGMISLFSSPSSPQDKTIQAYMQGGNSDDMEIRGKKKEWVHKQNQKRPVKVQMYDDPTCIDVIANVYKANMYEIYRPGFRERDGLVTFVRGRFALVVLHFIKRYKKAIEDGDLTENSLMTLRQVSCPEVHFEVPLKQFLRYHTTEMMEKNDLVMVYLDAMPERQDIVSKIITNDTLDRKTDKQGAIVTVNSGVVYVRERTLIPYESVEAESIDGSKHTYIEGFHYAVSTRSGDCGAPVYVMDKTSGAKKLAGIHVCGTGVEQGFCVVITQAEIRAIIDQFNKKDTIVQQFRYTMDERPGVSDKFIIVRPDRVLPQNTRSDIVPSPLYEKWGEAITAPSILKPIVINGEKKDPLLSKVREYSHHAPYLPEEVWDHFAMAQLEQCQRAAPDFKRVGVLTDEQAIYGIEGDPYMHSLTRGTSPGYEYGLRLLSSEVKFPGKILWMGEGPDKKGYDYQHLIDHMYQIEEMARKGVRTLEPFLAFPKSERLKKAKVEVGNTRCIWGSGMAFTAVWRKYFGDWCRFQQAGRIRNGVAIGVNPLGDEGEMMFKHVTEVGEDVMAGDYALWDASQRIDVKKSETKAINRWYNDKNDLIRNVLMTTVWNAIVALPVWDPVRKQLEMLLIETFGITPSGFAGTAVSNSFEENMYKRYGHWDCRGRPKDMMGTTEEYNKFVRNLSLGDDHLTGVARAIRAIFNMVTYRESLKKIGLVYTNAQKEKDFTELFVPLDKMQFLKRSFRKDEGLGRVVCPLELKTILEMPYWTKEGPAKRTIAMDNFNTAIHYLSMHDEETWNKWAPKMMEEYGKAYGCAYPWESRSLVLQRVIKWNDAFQP